MVFVLSWISLHRTNTIRNLSIYLSQEDEDGAVVAVPERLQLSAENISLSGVYLMDRGDILYLYLGKVAPQFFCEKVHCFFFFFKATCIKGYKKRKNVTYKNCYYIKVTIYYTKATVKATYV